MKTVTKIMLSVMLLLVSVLVFYTDCIASEPPAVIRGIRPLGMGGAFTAIADDQNAFFYNPAGLTQREKSMLTILDFSFSGSDDLLEYYQFIQDNQTELENFEEKDVATQERLINEINDKITKLRVHITIGIPNINFISGPIAFNSGNANFGLGLFDIVDLQVKMNASILIPTIDMEGSYDVIGIVPLAYKLDSTPFDIGDSLSLGASFKYIYRGRVNEKRKSILEFEEFDPALQKGTGMGLDLGLLLAVNEKLDAGLMISDFLGTTISYDAVTSVGQEIPATSSVITPQVNVGIAYKPSTVYYWPGKDISTGGHLTFACDLRDITDDDEKLFEDTFYKKLHLGAELSWKRMGIRSGFNQGYFTFGVGFGLPLLKLDYAYYTDELGRFAGQVGEANHMLTVALRFN